MESILLQAEDRPRGSKGSVHALRRRGMMPAVVYGKEAGNILVQMPEKGLDAILVKHSLGGTLINLEVTGESAKRSYLVMIRDVQRHPVRRELLHADFLQVSLTEELETELPVHLVGEAPGIKEGGILEHMLREVLIACLPTALPEHLEADLSTLHIGGQLKVSDIKPPEGVRIISEPEEVIAMVSAPSVEEEPVAEEEGAEVGTDQEPETEE
jgi:large subunit ribosomal protein L25